MFHKSARFYDAIYSFKDYAAEAATIHAAIQSHVPEARSVLDVACGTGLHMQHLAEHYEIEGLDLDPGLLEIARERLPGIRLHEGDMVGFDLGRTFDAVICLFSSIGYTQTIDAMRTAMQTMARHVTPGGILMVEGWLTPDQFETGHLGAVFVDEADLKIARINTTERNGSLSMLRLHYLVGTPEGVESFEERHELGLFTNEEYEDAMTAAGLDVHVDEEGLEGRGLFVGVRPKD